MDVHDGPFLFSGALHQLTERAAHIGQRTATALLIKKVYSEMVQEIVGHNQITTTRDIYFSELNTGGMGDQDVPPAAPPRPAKMAPARATLPPCPTLPPIPTKPQA